MEISLMFRSIVRDAASYRQLCPEAWIISKGNSARRVQVSIYKD